MMVATGIRFLTAIFLTCTPNANAFQTALPFIEKCTSLLKQSSRCPIHGHGHNTSPLNHAANNAIYATDTSQTTEESNNSKVSINANELYDAMGLSQDERTIVNVHRACSPSVVYVTSVLSSPASSASSGGGTRSRKFQQSQRQRNQRDDPNSNKKEDSENSEENDNRRLPQGMALGSGSGFVVDSDGYIVTNYHVIQRAYEANQAMKRYESFWDNLASNATKSIQQFFSTGGEQSEAIESFVNQTFESISRRGFYDTGKNGTTTMPAQVFVRFGSSGENGGTGSWDSATYLSCDIVDVVKELDIAVLKIQKTTNDKNKNLPPLQPLAFGSSSNLLVGQTLLAIGNPFGLDRTITSGLVSALGRSVTGVAGNPIRNCIQTDAAINPGNSGGPLLDLRGKVVGVNTMIITTSGSSAGIGFAVPGDKVNEVMAGIVDLDKEKSRRSGKRKGRGWLGVEVATGSLEEALRKRLPPHDTNEVSGAFLIGITDGSPASEQDLSPTSLDGGIVVLGDRIVDVGGKSIWNGAEFVSELKDRVDGEQLTLTVEDSKGDKRVAYVTLGSIPL